MKKRSLLYVNFAVLLFGLAGLFAKWIHLPAIAITFGRVFFSSVSLGIYMLLSRKSFQIKRKKDAVLLIAAGIILAVHWWAFLQSIQLSTVAIGTITFSAFPLFVTFLEPFVFHQRVKQRNVMLAVVILIGVCITIHEYSFENRMFLGVLIGLLSAVTYAVLTVLNKKLSAAYSGTLTAFYEQSTAAIVLLPFILRSGIHPSLSDLALLLFLGIITTALAHTLFISSLKGIPAQLAGIFSSLETVYGILFALMFLHEVPSFREIVGAIIILMAVSAAR